MELSEQKESEITSSSAKHVIMRGLFDAVTGKLLLAANKDDDLYYFAQSYFATYKRHIVEQTEVHNVVVFYG